MGDEVMTAILNKVKLSLRITTDDFDTELTDLINACLLDLGIAGVTEDDTTDALIIRAICTYCKIHFGDANGVEMLDRLQASYNEQKAQMSMATGYTDWGNE
jgi:hypothetical protein